MLTWANPQFISRLEVFQTHSTELKGKVTSEANIHQARCGFLKLSKAQQELGLPQAASERTRLHILIPVAKVSRWNITWNP